MAQFEKSYGYNHHYIMVLMWKGCKFATHDNRYKYGGEPVEVAIKTLLNLDGVCSIVQLKQR